MIELRRLHAFVVTAEEGHVTRAAERLGMQQPPLTRLIRALEAELGVLLFQRLPRGVRPTEAGRVLLEEARAVLARAEALPDIVRRVARGEQGRLAVGFTSSAMLHPFVPAALRAFRESQPGVQITLDEAGTGELVDGVLHGRLDAAFVRSPVDGAGGLFVDPVLTEPMVAAIPASHPLAQGPGPLPLNAIAAEPLVLYRRLAGPGLYDTILSACRAAGFTPVVAQEAPRLPATLGLVAAGIGISIVPRSMARIAIGDVVFRDLSACPGLVAPLHLVLRRAGLPPTAARFRVAVQRLAACPGAEAAP